MSLGFRLDLPTHAAVHAIKLLRVLLDNPPLCRQAGARPGVGPLRAVTAAEVAARLASSFAVRPCAHPIKAAWYLPALSLAACLRRSGYLQHEVSQRWFHTTALQFDSAFRWGQRLSRAVHALPWVVTAQGWW